MPLNIKMYRSIDRVIISRESWLNTSMLSPIGYFLINAVNDTPQPNKRCVRKKNSVSCVCNTDGLKYFNFIDLELFSCYGCLLNFTLIFSVVSSIHMHLNFTLSYSFFLNRIHGFFFIGIVLGSPYYFWSWCTAFSRDSNHQFRCVNLI